MKKLFDAPWTAYPLDDVGDANGNFVCACDTQEMARRIARLPELYEALMDTVYYKCFECMGGLRHNIDVTQDGIIEKGCPKKVKSNVCIFSKHLELLKKVRDGK